MRVCEYYGCRKRAVGFLNVGGVRVYYCRRHLDLVERRLSRLFRK